MNLRMFGLCRTGADMTIRSAVSVLTVMFVLGFMAACGKKTPPIARPTMATTSADNAWVLKVSAF